MKPGSIVTVDYGPYNQYSNTFQVFSDSGEDVIYLNHPLAPQCITTRTLAEINIVSPKTQAPIERCLFYLKKHEGLLGSQVSGEMLGIYYYFILNRDLTKTQKSTISRFCGKVAELKFSSNVEQAVVVINQHAALLDEYNLMWFNKFSKLFKNPTLINTKSRRSAVFNMAGFVLAQLEINSTLKDD